MLNSRGYWVFPPKLEGTRMMQTREIQNAHGSSGASEVVMGAVTQRKGAQ